MLIRNFIFVILCLFFSGCAPSLLQPEADNLSNHLQNLPVKIIPEKEDVKIIIPINIGFSHRSSYLNSHIYPILDAVIHTLKNYPDSDVKIMGYTNSQQSERSNIILSEKRAKEIAHYLVKHGIRLRRIETLGFSQNNSRIEIMVYKKYSL